MSRVAIICVDDEHIILSSLGEQLKRNLGQDYDIELASSAQEALELCEELTEEGVTIALVISDQMMPGMPGDKFLIKLHTFYPKTLKILLTGQAGADSLRNIVNEAALYRYLTKPWDEEDLILTVKEALRCYGQEAQLVKQNLLLKQTNNKLSQSLKILLATFEATDDGILVLDNQGLVIICNQRFSELWQMDLDFNLKDINDFLVLISSKITEPLLCSLMVYDAKSNRQKANLLTLNNGKILELYFQTQRLAGKIVGRVWRFRDVTEKEHAEARARYKALHDTLTQLPKRSILTCRLNDAIKHASQNSHLVAIMFLDLDRFKIINDTLGHQVGDLLLKQVVRRLQNCLRKEDLISRWGNDEFSILLPQINNQEAISAIAIRLLEALKSPLKVNDRSIYITGSIGIAIYPEHGQDAETLLKNADAALSQAKQLNSNNYQYYNPTLNSQAHRLLIVENLLHSALEQDEFIVYYQPIVNISTGKITKMEALLRWNNPQEGLISPNVFIPLAEKNGEIIPIGEWVLKTACSQNKTWQEMSLPPIQISVNLSVRQFQQPNLVSMIANILEEVTLNPEYLELEITESITMQDTESAKTILEEFYRMGISLSMDDFGTGYSSLSYLKQFPFSTLKIDRSFIKDLNYSSQDFAIIDAIITLGEGLKLNIIAEGVETKELKDLLKSLGCKYIQGYLFSKPLPVAEATKLLQENMLEMQY